MPFKVLIFAHRKPGLSPTQFKDHWENSHIPLIQKLSGPSFPTTHSRRYIHRIEATDATSDDPASNESYPATVLVGRQADFSYDGFAELTFEDETAFQTFFGIISQGEAAKQLAEDEEKFLDRAKMTAVVVGDHIETVGTSSQ